MLISLHKNATTTPAIRRAIQTSTASTAELARQYGLALDTVRKWRRRDSVEDLSHTPHRLQKTLNDGQEALVVYLRTEFRLSLDDLLAVIHEFIEPSMSRSALDRMLRLHGVSRRPSPASEPTTPPKRFKAYEPGYVHIDVKYLPQMQDEDQRRYLCLRGHRPGHALGVCASDEGQVRTLGPDLPPGTGDSCTLPHSHDPDRQRQGIHRPVICIAPARRQRPSCL